MWIDKFAYNKYVNAISAQDDHDFVMTRVYTHDESDIKFREPDNMVDGAVRRTKILSFAKDIKEQRAKHEREAMLDAYNYLNKK